jgi:CRISPR-associated protein Cmr5
MTRQQRWAKHAYQCVLSYKANGDKAGEAREKKLATLCMKAPSLLQQAGLVQAIPFLQTRSDEGKTFVADLARGLDLKSAAELQTTAHGAPLADYMALSHEVIGLATWFRRFAQAELKGDEGRDAP